VIFQLLLQQHIDSAATLCNVQLAGGPTEKGFESLEKRCAGVSHTLLNFEQ